MTASRFIGTVLVLAVFPSLASAKDWVEIKNPNELRALFSNKTFKGTGWIAYYRADGTGTLVIDGGKPIARKWEVKGDQVCITGDATEVSGCRRFQRHRKERNVLLMTNPLSNMTYTVTVEDGIPKH